MVPLKEHINSNYTACLCHTLVFIFQSGGLGDF